MFNIYLQGNFLMRTVDLQLGWQYAVNSQQIKKVCESKTEYEKPFYSTKQAGISIYIPLILPRL